MRYAEAKLQAAYAYKQARANMGDNLAPTTSPQKSQANASTTLQAEPFVTAAELAQMTFPEADLLIEDILPRTCAC
jgi:hypothetical protein